MSKIVIDENLKGKELYKFLVENKTALIAQKKAFPKKTDNIGGLPSFYQAKGPEAVKTSIGEIPEDANVLSTEIVANAAMWFDSQRDVLLTDCWKKTIKDGNGRLHLKDHTHEMDAEVGDVTNIYAKNLSLTELGLNKSGTTQCLVYASDVRKEYDPKTFSKYKRGRVKQHSIGLQYVKIDLAINDPDSEKEYTLWNKYIDQIINKEEAEEIGFFWAVSEIKLIEVSAVIAGANRLTPTLWVGAKTSEGEPDEDTHDEPPQGTQGEPSAQSEGEPIIKQLLTIF